MRSLIARTFVIVVGVLASGIGTDAAAKLSLRVSPAVGTAPGYVTVTATVPPNADNRVLEIAADSGSFYRSSEIQLEGERAPLITQVTLKNLPGGEYTIVVVLRDAAGHRTVAQSMVVILPGLGQQ